MIVIWCHAYINSFIASSGVGLVKRFEVNPVYQTRRREFHRVVFQDWSLYVTTSHLQSSSFRPKKKKSRINFHSKKLVNVIARNAYHPRQWTLFLLDKEQGPYWAEIKLSFVLAHIFSYMNCSYYVAVLVIAYTTFNQICCSTSDCLYYIYSLGFCSGNFTISTSSMVSFKLICCKG